MTDSRSRILQRIAKALQRRTEEPGAIQTDGEGQLAPTLPRGSVRTVQAHPILAAALSPGIPTQERGNEGCSSIPRTHTNVDAAHISLNRCHEEPDIAAKFHELIRPPQAALGLAPIENPVQHFILKAQESGAKTAVLSRLAEVPAWLHSVNATELKVALAPQAPLAAMDWSRCTLTENSRDGHIFAVALANGGAAETGSLCLNSHQVPSGLLFLAEALLVIIHVDDIYPRYEDLWQSSTFSNEKTPRAVHLITGPSRTADVEQTIQIGAHGPRELFIAVIDQRV